MKKSFILIPGLLMITALLLIMSGCQKKQKEAETMTLTKTPLLTFGEELQFLSQHTDVVVLSDSTGKAKLIAAPAWQGRVMTSSADGDKGLSFGWINHELIKNGEVQEHINVFGGEDRIWLGPEGGQFSIFFKNGDPFNLDHWYVPAMMDTEAFETIETDQGRTLFRKKTSFTNYSGFAFDVELTREVKILEETDIASQLGMDIPADIHSIGYITVNTLTNTGKTSWTKETGCLSIWILGMFNPSPQTTVVIPYIQGNAIDLGPVVNDTYFGKVPADRLKIENGLIYFKVCSAPTTLAAKC
jgi:hypothetical protein